MAVTMSNHTTSTPQQSYHYPRPATIRAWRADVAEALNDAGLEKIATRWLSCSDTPKTMVKPVAGAALPKNAEKVYVCSDNHLHPAEIYAQSCDLRICPECARRQAARLVHRYLPLFNELAHQHHNTYRFRHIVFTLPYGLEDADIRQRLLTGFKQVEQVMTGLMDAPGWNGIPWQIPTWKTEQGFLSGAEFGETGYKLHFHVIHYGQYLNQADLSRRWSDATGGDACIVFVRGMPYAGHTIEENLREVLKYCVKFYSQDKVTGKVTALPAHLMPVLARVLEKTRRIRTYGLFYNVPEPDRAAHSCDSCGSDMVAIPVDYFVTFCNTGIFPSEWAAPRDDAGLLLKPADKSSGTSSGISPPTLSDIRKRQMQFSITQKLRWQAKDEF